MGTDQIHDDDLVALDGQNNNKFDDKSTEQVAKDHIGDLIAEEVEDRRQARDFREHLITYTKYFSVVYFVFLTTLCLLQGFHISDFDLDVKIFIMLTSLGGIHVLGLLGIVLRYLFSINSGLFVNTPAEKIDNKTPPNGSARQPSSILVRRGRLSGRRPAFRGRG